MTNKLDRVYNKLRGRKLCGLEAQCFNEVIIQEVIRHRLGVPEHEHPYHDVDMVDQRVLITCLWIEWNSIKSDASLRFF